MCQFLGAILFQFCRAQINGNNKLNLFSRYSYFGSVALGAAVVESLCVHKYAHIYMYVQIQI